MNKLVCFVALLVGCGSVKSGGDGDAGGENEAPTDIELSDTSVEEQAPPGTRVGLLSAVDPDNSDRHTFELLDDAGGLFALDGDALEVAPDAIPNFETGASATVTVKATDDAGASVEKDLEIEILDLLEVVNTLDTGAGSLRQTIADAEPGETILFETGLDPSISVNSDLLLTKAVTIRGPLPPAEIVLDALGNNRVFAVSVAANATLQQLRIRGGSATSGGAIQNQGILLVERSIIEDSIATGSGRGGAIQNTGTLTARDTSFLRNQGYNGGAVAADSADGTVIERCTFQDNHTTGNSGGGIVGGSLKVVNSTFTGNTATDPSQDRVGGAIAVAAGANEIAFSTFAGNSVDGQGGAIFCFGSDAPATLNLHGSIVSGNDAGLGGLDIFIDTDCTADGDHNVISVGAGSGFTNGTDGNVVGTPVTLDELGNNGGFTQTLLPDDGAPSIDIVPPEMCTGPDGPLADDQRGEPRPAGDGCDAGSVEQ